MKSLFGFLCEQNIDSINPFRQKANGCMMATATATAYIKNKNKMIRLFPLDKIDVKRWFV